MKHNRSHRGRKIMGGLNRLAELARELRIPFRFAESSSRPVRVEQYPRPFGSVPPLRRVLATAALLFLVITFICGWETAMGMDVGVHEVGVTGSAVSQGGSAFPTFLPLAEVVHEVFTKDYVWITAVVIVLGGTSLAAVIGTIFAILGFVDKRVKAIIAAAVPAVNPATVIAQPLTVKAEAVYVTRQEFEALERELLAKIEGALTAKQFESYKEERKRDIDRLEKGIDKLLDSLDKLGSSNYRGRKVLHHQVNAHEAAISHLAALLENGKEQVMALLKNGQAKVEELSAHE